MADVCSPAEPKTDWLGRSTSLGWDFHESNGEKTTVRLKYGPGRGFSATLRHGKVRAPLIMIFDQSLSIFTNFFASRGICLAMSPPMNTDSRLVQSNWTFTHSSRVSVALLSSLSLFCEATSAESPTRVGPKRDK